MKTHVVMLLDESTSMGPHQSAVVNTFNEYVNALKEGKRTWLSLFKFAGEGTGGFHSFSQERRFTAQGAIAPNTLKKVFENRRVTETYPLTMEQYTPHGWTPLYDAIGELIKRTKKRLPKEAKVLFVIHTDGQENTSRVYNMERIKTMIARMENKRGWTFVYLGEGAAAWNAGYDFGIDNVANFSSTMRGASMGKLATATMNYVCDSSVGASMGTTKTFYANAGLDADDVDPEETLKTTSSVITTSAESADNNS